MHFKILIVDDDTEFQKLLVNILGSLHTVISALTLDEARSMITKSNPDLILLDLSLPDGDGMSFFAELQSTDNRQIPVMIITANTEVNKEIIGFSLGAEDFIMKPIDSARLRARIESRVKQIQSRKNQDVYYNNGSLKLSLSTQQAYLMKENKEAQIELTPIEFKLLFHLLRHEEHIFTREQLINTVWGKSEMSDRTIDMHVSNLRKKIAESEFKIRPIHGVGYRISRLQ